MIAEQEIPCPDCGHPLSRQPRQFGVGTLWKCWRCDAIWGRKALSRAQQMALIKEGRCQ